jgi:F-type H+-transporting ATPase subunit b
MKAIAPLAASLLLAPQAVMAEGMPQLDFNTPLTISQVVWGAIIFYVLYRMLSGTGLPMVASVLEERADKIAADLETARASKASADAGMAEAQAATLKARAEAQSAINAAVTQAKEAAALQAETLNARLEKQLQESEAQINAARAAAMGAIRQVATETCATVVQRLTGAAPDSAKLDNAIGSALAARGLS